MTTHSDIRLFDRRTAPHIATLTLLCGVSALTMNVFLPSLPGMAAYFEADYRLMQLSVALYLAMNAVLQIIVGPLSDQLGRRPVMLVGLGFFILASLGCILGPTVEVFLAFRMCQAAVVVGMVLSRAIVRDMYARDKAASMLGYVTMGMAVVPMIAPLVGGILDESFGWKANFWLMAGLGLAMLVLTWSDLGETSGRSGMTLMQQIREYPELLRSPRFWGYSCASGMAAGAFFAYLGGAPFVGQELYGMTPTELGFYFGAPAIGYFAGNYISGRYSIRFGVNQMVLWGCVLNTVGIVLSLGLYFVGLGSAQSFFALMTFVGLGNGMTIPNATAGALSVRPHLAGSAAGLNGAFMLGLGAALSSLAGAVLTVETGALPLLYLMLASALGGWVSIVVVIMRARQLGLSG